MDRKGLKIMLVVLSMMLLLMGCGKSDDVSGPVADNSKGNPGGRGNISSRDRPDMYGRVESILGNEVKLLVAEMPERTRSSGMNAEEREEKRSQMQNMGPEKRQQMMQDSIKFTGETETLMIPVGVPIASMKQGETAEMDLGDIYEGMFLQIWFNEEDESGDKTVKAVRAAQGR
ncbi:MAG: hypothetical protein MJB12_15060 [Firmicutes bacterium]|nr:hypothetical protein [Bacillota bacterium]